MGDASYTFIERVFSPFVAVSASEDAEELCLKNGLTFSELIRPFSENIEVSLKDSSGNFVAPVKIKINFRDLTTPSPQASAAKRLLSEAVQKNQPDIDGGPQKTLITQGLYEVDVCSTTPWYHAYRDAFFQGLPALEHDFTRHFLACVFVVSSCHQAPQQQLQQLIHNFNQIQLNLSHHSKWFFADVAHYYVLIHDGSTGDNPMAEATFLSMKNLHGPSNCHMLTINSVTPSNPSQDNDIWTPLMDCAINSENGILPVKVETNGIKIIGDHPLDPLSPIATSIEEPVSPTALKKRGAWLTTTDRENIKTFVSDFASQCLGPFAEQQLRNLSEQVANKKGIHRSFANAAKSFFAGRGKANILASNNPNAANSVIYSQQAPELLVRKLGDLAFLFHQYEIAYNAYHAAKRDFHGDQAWLYCAGAEEMAALSVFMLGKDGPRPYPAHYFDNAINAYLNVCKLSQLATRATLLHAECLRSLQDYQSLATQLIKMISEDSDLRSALLLEQAAYCYLKTEPLQLRKYAFHMVLAGHRYSKAGLRKHSLRAYREAEQVYRGRNWSVAEDHILFIIGRQCAALGRVNEAFQAFHGLLTKPSQQNAHQQSLFVKEYLTTVRTLNTTEFEMPLPTIDMNSVRTTLGLVSSKEESKTVHEDWQKLEECCYLKATDQKCPPFNYRNTVDVLDRNTLNDRPPVAVQNESITVELAVTNPLHINLCLSQIHLCWELVVDGAGTRISNCEAINIKEQSQVHKPEDFIETCHLEFINLEAKQTIVIKLTLIPKCEGQLEILGVSYQISLPSVSPSPSANSLNSEVIGLSPATPSSEFQGSPVKGYQTLIVKGPKEKNAKKVKNNQWYAADFRLRPIVGPCMPCLKVEFDSFPTQMLCGEVQRLNLRLTNTASQGLSKLFVGARNPKELTFGSGDSRSTPPSHATYKEMPAKGTSGPSVSAMESIGTSYVTRIPGVDSIEPGATVSVPVWIRGPDVTGEHEIMLLFYYEHAEKPQNSKMQHRVCKFSAKVTTISSLVVHANAEPSIKVDDVGSVLVSVHAKNSSELEGSKSVDLSLLQVTLISEMFTIAKHLDMPPRTPTHSLVTTIRPREVKDIALKLQNEKLSFVASERESQKPLKKISQWPLSIVKVESSSTPCAEFMMASASRLGELKDENAPLTNKEILDIEVAKLRGTVAKELRDPLDLTVSIIWKAAVERDGAMQVVMGQHQVNMRQMHVTYTSFPHARNKKNLPPIGGPLLNLSNQAHFPIQSDASKLVSVSLLHSDYIQHNFEENPALIVEVTLVLHNPSVESEVDLMISCMDSLAPKTMPAPPLGVSSGLSFNPSPQNQDQTTDDIGGFVWTTKSRMTAKLSPAHTEKIGLKALFTSTGTFNVASGLCISVKTGDQLKLLSPFQSFLILDEAK